jgi:hypothetical protein
MYVSSPKKEHNKLMYAASNSILFLTHFNYIVITSNADAARLKNVSLKRNFAVSI